MKKPVILTGIRSNEEPTIANYLGAMLPMVAMQKDHKDTHQINMFVPDLHSFTTPIDHSTLYANTLHNLKYYAAIGLDLDHESTFIYRQSYIPAHSELAWILSCFTHVGEMQRMTQFKEKSQEKNASVSMGLMTYPILMAADILLYNTTYVPVGEDQFQHLEITRDIALRFNSTFGDIFTIPKSTAEQTRFIQRDKGLRIRSLTNPEKKMSKSSQDQKSKINLSDDSTVARKKIMGATTDSLQSVAWDWENQPGVTNLMQLLALFSNTPQEQVASQWNGCSRYGDLKTATADAVCEFLDSFHEKYNALSDEYIVEILERNEAKMSIIAQETLTKAQVAVGVRPPKATA